MTTSTATLEKVCFICKNTFSPSRPKIAWCDTCKDSWSKGTLGRRASTHGK